MCPFGNIIQLSKIIGENRGFTILITTQQTLTIPLIISLRNFSNQKTYGLKPSYFQ